MLSDLLIHDLSSYLYGPALRYRMKFLTFLAFVTTVACASVPYDSDLNEYWEHFKKLFNKAYNQYEEEARRIIWEQRVADIVRHNLGADLGIHSYTKGIHKYSDMSTKRNFEKTEWIKSSQRSLSSNGSVWLPPSNAIIPDNVDWREQGFVTEVKDQETAVLAGHSRLQVLWKANTKANRKISSLSEQNLMDCSVAEGNHGCDGGWMDQAFEYVKKNNGIDTERLPIQRRCKFMESFLLHNYFVYIPRPTGTTDSRCVHLVKAYGASVLILELKKERSFGSRAFNMVRSVHSG
ncbi:cathepsin S [Caerostris extrusa]|uniref:Cathepsin S n=1 Tax=Caerostris extrusa TaxID=172846 RepID=A0AAV4Y859_CAEEX|nr:cathepsin S [Caerostris extrusa]